MLIVFNLTNIPKSVALFLETGEKNQFQSIITKNKFLLGNLNFRKRYLEVFTAH